MFIGVGVLRRLSKTDNRLDARRKLWAIFGSIIGTLVWPSVSPRLAATSSRFLFRSDEGAGLGSKTNQLVIGPFAAQQLNGDPHHTPIVQPSFLRPAEFSAAPRTPRSWSRRKS